MRDVHLFIPCFIDQLYPETGFNMVKVLEKFGCSVHYNPAQTCCGQPAFNSGFWDEARDVCSKFVEDFRKAEVVVGPSASCVGFVRNYYGKMFENGSQHNQVKALTAKTYEFSEFLIDVLKVKDVGATLHGVGTYHSSCASLRECRLGEGPLELLSHVRGLELKPLPDAETCCGFGGTFAAKFTSISVNMGEQKVENAVSTGAEYLISTDWSCLMHLQGYATQHGHGIKAMHLADVLASGW
ncbi:MAG: (Fe-S)-binding protein [Niabella sp.]